MSLVSILKSFWVGDSVSVQEISDTFGIDKTESRVRLRELSEEYEVIQEVQKDLFVGDAEKEEFVDGFEEVFSDRIQSKDDIAEIVEQLGFN
jgi:predicted transcriptional regulator